MARREQRERLVLPVKVYGSNARGEPFTDMACITDMSQNGARVEGLQCIVHPNEIVSLEHSGQRVQFRVAWVGDHGTRLAGCVGLQSLRVMPSLFGRELPPPGPDTFDPTVQALSRDSGTIDRRVQERRQQPERRRHPRYKCTGSVEIRISGTQLTTWAKVSDVCLGGCYAELTSPFPVATALELTVNVADERVHTKGVVRSHHPGFGMGIQFDATAPEQQAKLQRAVEVLSGKLPPAPPQPKVVPIGTRPMPAGPLEAIVKWFGTHENLSRTEFLQLIEKDVKKPTG